VTAKLTKISSFFPPKNLVEFKVSTIKKRAFFMVATTTHPPSLGIFNVYNMSFEDKTNRAIANICRKTCQDYFKLYSGVIH